MSALWLQVKYADIISGRLLKYKIKKRTPYLSNFRCPYCGDSETNQHKARGYLYERNGGLYFTCHNCGQNATFNTFLKHVDPQQYNDYRFESLKEKNNDLDNKEQYVPDIAKFSKPRFQHYEPLAALKKISQLPLEHGARKYVDMRRIPRDNHYRLYYAKRFCAWVNTLIPDKFSEPALKHDEPRLVIPLIDQNGYVFGFQGRSFRKGDDVIRYITIMLDESKPKVFGLDTVDFRKKCYVVEGPIDSLFLPNAIAMAGSDIQDGVLNAFTDKVLVFDNQPRNLEVVNKIRKAAREGYKVAIWPQFMQWKDINDMVWKGEMSPVAVQELIDINTFSGLEAELQLAMWAKV